MFISFSSFLRGEGGDSFSASYYGTCAVPNAHHVPTPLDKATSDRRSKVLT